MASLAGNDIRFAVEPGDVPPVKAARRLHLSETDFLEVLPRLLGRGFPQPDPDTGMFDLEAIDRWRHSRHRALFPEYAKAAGPEAQNEQSASPGDVFRERQAARQRRRAA